MTETREVEIFFDVGSPYSYLAATQMPGLRERTGAAVVWRPFLLGGVFKATGNEMPARIAKKARFMMSDLDRWAAQYGVPFRMNSHFPVNTLSAQRTLLAADELFGQEATERLAMALFEAMWVDDEDVSSGDTIAYRVNRCGLDARALMKRVGDDDLKQRLKDVTNEAVERGAFGAPTFFVGETMFWGNDRLHMVEAHLKEGTSPTTTA